MFTLGQKVWAQLDNGKWVEGEIEDRCGNEYSVRTEEWRSKKWFLETEISLVGDVEECEMDSEAVENQLTAMKNQFQTEKEMVALQQKVDSFVYDERMDAVLEEMETQELEESLVEKWVCEEEELRVKSVTAQLNEVFTGKQLELFVRSLQEEEVSISLKKKDGKLQIVCKF